jgi:hypothetical protein
VAAEFWSARPWARVFDLISGAYGWRDDDILDLPFARVRQLAAVLSQRETERDNARRAIAQAVAQHVVGAVYSAGGAKPHQARRAAAGVRLLHRPRVRPVPRVEQVAGMLGQSVTDLIDIGSLEGGGSGG